MSLAAALCIGNSERRWLHAGVVFFFADQHWVAHLAWHHIYIVRPANEVSELRRGWCRYPLPARASQTRAVGAIALARKLREEQTGERIPFGMGFGGEVRPDGSVDLFGSLGFTCATFAHALLRRGGFPMFDFDGWPRREEDLPWYEGILAEMRTGEVPPEHVAAFEAQKGQPRLRAEEVVAGAALVATYGARLRTCDEVEPVGVGIRATMFG